MKRAAGPDVVRSLLAWSALCPTLALAEWPTEGHSYHIDLDYAGEAWHAADGGRQTGSAYLDNLDLVLEVDGERAAGITGLKLFAHALYNNGGAISEHRVGDAQGVSGIEAVRAVRLLQLWTEWSGAGEDHSLLVGLYDLNSEFDVIPSAELFLGASHGMGREFSQTGENGPSTFPVTGLALRYRRQLSAAWYTHGAVLDGVPGDPEDAKSTTITLSSDDGALVAAELVRETPGSSKFALGAWHYTATCDDLLELDAAGEARRRRSNRGAYALADVTLMVLSGQGGIEPARLSAFLRYGVANHRLNRFGQYLGAGVVLHNAILRDDALGLAVSHARNGDVYRDLKARSGELTDAHETIAELTWKVPVNDWLTLQPNLQYVRNPDTDPGLDNALALGLRFELSLGTSI